MHYRDLLPCCLALILGVTALVPAAEFYVAPDGDDAALGSLEQPFASLARARDAIRDLKKRSGGALAEPVTVRLRGGIYYMTEPLLLTPEDSGTAAHPIVYEAFPGEQPVLSGGRSVTGWQRADAGYWTAHLPEVSEAE